MTRHGKNSTNGMVYTYHERKRDARVSGFGTDHMRASKDSVQDFDACCLTLQPCRNPVITADGFLYDKEAILQYIITKKNEISRQLKQYEKEKRTEQTELRELAAAEQRSQLRQFQGQEASIISKASSAAGAKDPTGDSTSSSAPSSSSVSNVSSDKAKQLPSFWIPSLTPSASRAALKKPDTRVYCPMSGRPLKLKQLQPVRMTRVNDPDDQSSLISRRNRYMCCVTHDILGNSVPCAILKPTGDVVTVECLERLIRKDMRHPISGEQLQESDIIVMHMGGTGFAGTNSQLTTSGPRPVMQV